jgi:hypothetical protein
VKTLVEIHGGVVEARSEGPGSEFLVRLPAPALSAAQQPKGRPESDHGAVDPTPRPRGWPALLAAATSAMLSIRRIEPTMVFFHRE